MIKGAKIVITRNLAQFPLTPALSNVDRRTIFNIMAEAF
jgi:hypothetical protein